MNINKYLFEIGEEFGSKFDNIKKENKHKLDIDRIFITENNILKDIEKIKDKSQNLDIAYINYNKIKENYSKKINAKRRKLIDLNNQKNYYDRTNPDNKLKYITQEYLFYKEQTQTKKYMNSIKLLRNKIEFILKNTKSKKITDKYNKIKDKYTNVVAFIKCEEYENKINKPPANFNEMNKINWYNERINEMIEKQMIFNNYIFLLENFYKEIIDYELNKIKTS